MARRKFLKGGSGHNFHIVFKRIFFQLNSFEADCETIKALGRSGGMIPWKNFFHAVMAILVLLE